MYMSDAVMLDWIGIESSFEERRNERVKTEAVKP
jgi:hypothetical protein